MYDTVLHYIQEDKGGGAHELHVYDLRPVYTVRTGRWTHYFMDGLGDKDVEVSSHLHLLLDE